MRRAAADSTNSHLSVRSATVGLAGEIDKDALAEAIDQMQSDPDVEWVEPDIFIRMEDQDARKSGLEQKLPWGIDRIGGTSSSTVSGDGKGEVSGVHLFILDSGVSPIDVNVNMKERENYTNSDKDYDVYGHGMHIAATAAARDDYFGIVGVAPNAKTWSLKVLDENGETDMSTVIAALDRVIEIQKGYPGIPAVVNISFGGDVGTTAYTSVDEAVDAAVAAGITVVVAAGNDGIDASTVTPAHAKGAITVGAYDVYNRFAGFSNYGASVDILAPGVDILSLGTFSDWSIMTGVTMTGTSMATPHVSGAALLYLSSNPKATPAAVKKALIKAGKSEILAVPAGTTNKTVWVGKF